MPMNHRAKFDTTSFTLSLPEKSVTIQTHNKTNKQKTKNSKQYIHTLPIGMCE